MADETTDAAEALEALQVWLLTEDAYARGGVPDEVLTFMQDHLGRLLGPRAVEVGGDFLRRQVGDGGDLAGVARDRSALTGLLALIEGKRRRGFEMEWRAFPLVAADGEAARPEALLVMAEYGVEDPVWDRPRGSGDPVSLTELGVSRSLVRRLRAWNETLGRRASSEASWVEEGLTLARELQQELPDLDIRYFHADDDRPLRSV